MLKLSLVAAAVLAITAAGPAASGPPDHAPGPPDHAPGPPDHAPGPPDHAPGPPDDDEEPTSGSFTLLHDTHFHGNYHDDRVGEDGASISQYMGLARERYEALDQVLFVGAGDDLGSSVESAVFEGQHMIDALNASVFDYNTFGNHDFDYGAANLYELTGESEFQWLSANVRDADDPDEVFAADQGAAKYAIEELDGVTVGLTGVGPRGMEDFTSTDGEAIEIDAAEALPPVIDELHDEGADVVVVMNHLLNPHAEEVAGEVDGIDVFVGGHSHAEPREPIVIEAGETDTIFSYVGYEFEHLGELELHVEEGDVADFDFTMHDLDPEQEADEAVQDVQDAYEAELDEELDEPIGATADTWGSMSERAEQLEDEGYDVRDQHNRVFLADVLRDWGDADVGLTNTGGVRDDFTAGEAITRRDVLSMLPFANYSVLIELSGAELEQLMEDNFVHHDTDEDRTRYFQVSGAQKFVDLDAEHGDRVTQLEIAGEPVDPDGTYTVAAFDFLLDRGEAYEMLNEGEMLIDPQAGGLLSELVMDYVEEREEVDARVDGWIVYE
ncbi:bifunctional metallophosphatase/5'-nucleotidase [Egibacter rhizosphaerae]|uniref:Bifunctional metallophosphatase/5'-nucleotidase n=1 Tax=Egibacter rhizosphaerae TaxID=1670831 RepID=A0A411YBL1_9ACTN|nr:5'-nucleotidase C-terminal domain-containing protein [Egibacter rhizosphaerae]QBI18589.1 bifunctional metallophosphatase/5'-nucleotidase [Egibacter rhizosphaerae]